MSECQISGILAMHLHTTRLPMKSTLSCLIACISQGIYAEEPVTEVQRLAPIVVEATRTDRTLLNSIFEHQNCISIKPFYFEKDGSNDYEQKSYSIARHFKSKAELRDKVVNKEYCQAMIQPVNNYGPNN